MPCFVLSPPIKRRQPADCPLVSAKYVPRHNRLRFDLLVLPNRAMDVTPQDSGGKGEPSMSTFTIDSDNNITALAGLPTGAEESQSFSTSKELAKLTAEWPASRLVETWN